MTRPQSEPSRRTEPNIPAPALRPPAPKFIILRPEPASGLLEIAAASSVSMPAAERALAAAEPDDGTPAYVSLPHAKL